MHERSTPRTRRRLALAAGALAVLVILSVLSAGAYLVRGGRGPWAPRPTPQVSASELMARARLATVTVRVALFRSGTRDGQGFVIDRRGIVVTSAYLLRRAQSVSVIDGHGVTADAGLIGMDSVTGVAELFAPTIASGRLALGPEKAAAGVHVLVPGGPPAGVATASIVGLGRDTVIGTTHLSGLIELGGTAVPSTSGGPVLDPQGRVVAVTVADTSPAGHALAAPVWPALAELTGWARDPVVDSFTRPLVTADVHALMLQAADLPAGFRLSDTSDESSGTTKALGLTYTSDAAGPRGGQNQSSFVVVYLSEAAAKGGYQRYIDDERTAGYGATATAVQLGDQGVLNTKRDPAPPGGSTVDRFQVIWRDRNVVCIAELVVYTGDAHPDVLDIAARQEARIAADPPSD